MSRLTKKFKFLVLMLSIFLLNSLAYADEPTSKYSIYIDAGSSGSRLYLYQYKNANLLPIINEVFSKKTSPGLSSFENNPKNASNSIQELLESCLQFLKKNNIHLEVIPVNVLSTAGMRLLTQESQTKIYNAIKELVKKNRAFSIGEIGTITGKKEGLYGWLAVNYLARTFQNELPTLGSIDVGNASAQIVFENENKKNQNQIFVVKLNKKTYHVVSKSFLGLGALEARKTIASTNAINSITSCYPLNYPLNETHVGKFNFKNCSHLYTQFIEKNHINTSPYYPKKIKFIAYSTIYSLLRFLDVDTKPSEKNIIQAIQTVCINPWETLVEKYSQKEKASYLPFHCADATYISALLFKGYQLSEQQLLIKREINGHKIAWPLGALLYHLTLNIKPL